MKQLITLFLLLLSFASFAQNKQGKLKLFVDCNTYCDFDYLKREITLVDYTPDNKAADVHVLITEQGNGGGGSQVQMIFFGQNDFKNFQDTIRYNVEPNSTQFVRRELLIKYLQLGLAPYIVKTDYARYATISMKQNTDNKNEPEIKSTKDKWNYWVFNIGGTGNINVDKVYQDLYYRGSVSASRITDTLKVTFSFSLNKNKTTYHVEDPYGAFAPFDVISNRSGFNANHQLVKSINQHWSYGYNALASRSTFSNLKLQASFNPSIEYNIFPYSQSSNKMLTIRYGLGVQYNKYYDTTLFFKTQETTTGQTLNVGLSFTQKWGSSSVGLNYLHYFMDTWKFYNVSIGGSVNVRVTSALWFNLGVYGGLVRDQIYLPYESADPQDILTRRIQLASKYNYFSYFGINYRFGSKLNNFVNPRFDGAGNFYF